MKHKKVLVPVVALSLLIGAGVIHAQTSSGQAFSRQGGTNPMNTIATAIAQKFNLNASDVQAVINQTMEAERAAMKAKMQEQIGAQLAKAVTDGKITQAQADLIKAKAAELKSAMEADRTAAQSLTPEQMKAKMQANMTALQAWATANNIPKELLHFVGGGPGPGGKRPMHAAK